MNLSITLAELQDVQLVAGLVLDLTDEIVARCEGVKFQRDMVLTGALCADWLASGIYTVLLAHAEGRAVGLAAFSETHALYAGGKIGVLQECYVVPDARGHGVGKRLLDEAVALAGQRGWVCMELCTPPLPEFAGAIEFYRGAGFVPVGGRKMRRQPFAA